MGFVSRGWRRAPLPPGTTKVVHSSAENAGAAEAAAARQLLDRGIPQMRRRRPGSAKAAM